ncbi:hypothetical protein [Taibaiella koreensis]|uniref:hypothetical protein n=1 Tax=Taibaiella koreensis TaxID=1268548 RepID=UPI000E599F32|nr:hypothetical protein [Taibaiella koreensis]
MKKISALLLALMLMVSGVTFAQDKTAPKTKPAATQTSKPADKAAPGDHTKKDGTPDKRYKENKKMKKDGTPDMRYKENKDKKAAAPAAK